jgi:hypothetical protein
VWIVVVVAVAVSQCDIESHCQCQRSTKKAKDLWIVPLPYAVRRILTTLPRERFIVQQSAARL